VAVEMADASHDLSDHERGFFVSEGEVLRGELLVFCDLGARTLIVLLRAEVVL